MRERWFGATGRKVPQIALEGTIDLEGALVLDDPASVPVGGASTPGSAATGNTDGTVTETPSSPPPGADGYCTYTGVPCSIATQAVDCPDVGPNDIVQVCANRVCSNNPAIACDDTADCGGAACPPGRCTLQGGVTCNDEAACPDTTDNVCETVNLSGQLNTPGQFLAATFTLPQGIDCTQTLESGLLFAATQGFNQPLQENIRSTCLATPAYNSVNPTTGGPVPARP